MKEIIIILCLLISFNLNCVDILKYNFFGFNLSQNQKDIENFLEEQKKEVNIYNINDNDMEYTVIEPIDQNITERENLDFHLLFYNKKLIKILKFNVNESYIKKIEKDFGISKKIEINSSVKIIEWQIGKVTLRIRKESLMNSIEIFNNKIEENSTINSNTKIFIPTVTNLRFRETPTSDGKIIRTLTKGEKLELIEKGEEETINGVKGNWVKVKTDKGEIGWCFDGYLEELK